MEANTDSCELLVSEVGLNTDLTSVYDIHQKIGFDDTQSELITESSHGIFNEVCSVEKSILSPNNVHVIGESLLEELGSNLESSIPLPVNHILLPEECSDSLSTIFDDVSQNCLPGNVQIDDIQLYLECSDDTETVVDDGNSRTSFHSIFRQATSQIKSDLQFKISFPPIPDEEMKVSKCPICKKMFVSREYAREHVLLEHKEQVNICRLCPYFTKSEKLFRTHMNTRHKGEPFTYTNTNVIHNSSLSPEMYSQLVTDQCPEVGGDTEITMKGRADADQANNNGYSTVSKEMEEVLQHNLEAVNKTIYFACEHCQFVTHASRLLSYHRNTMHNESRITYKCSVCTYTCKQKRSFQAHMNKHDKVYEFACAVCGKLFVSRHLLTKHSRVHKMVITHPSETVQGDETLHTHVTKNKLKIDTSLTGIILTNESETPIQESTRLNTSKDDAVGTLEENGIRNPGINANNAQMNDPCRDKSMEDVQTQTELVDVVQDLKREREHHLSKTFVSTKKNLKKKHNDTIRKMKCI